MPKRVRKISVDAPKITEHGEQVAVIEWVRSVSPQYPCLEWLLAVPNGAKLPFRKTKGGGRYAPQALRLLAEGLKPGVSDLFLPYAAGPYYGLWIELKIMPNKTTDHQKEFIRAMNENGYLAVVCYGADQAIATIKAYIDYGPHNIERHPQSES